jgi:hypothetical protein
MKLSRERQTLVENIIQRKCREFSSKHKNELIELYGQLARRNQWRTKLNNKHTEHMQEIADMIVVIIISRISLQLNNETNARALQVPEFLRVSSAIKDSINRITDQADQDFRIAVEESALESKREREKRMNEKLILEKEQKRYRVLRRIYEESDGNPTVEVSEEVIIEKEGISADELVDGILYYLVEERLVKYMGSRTVAIDHLGIREIENSIKHPNHDTEHFQSTIIQNFHGTVYGVQTGGQYNTQNVVINRDFNESISKLTELVNKCTASDIQREDAVEALERLPKLAQKEKSPDVIEAAKKRLDLVKTTLEISTNLSQIAMPYLKYLYNWFQG